MFLVIRQDLLVTWSQGFVGVVLDFEYWKQKSVCKAKTQIVFSVIYFHRKKLSIFKSLKL